MGMTMVAGTTVALATGGPAQAAGGCSGSVFKTQIVENYSTGARMGKLEGFRLQKSSTTILYCFKVTRDSNYINNHLSEIDLVIDGRPGASRTPSR
jgi:hypothetical protein